MSENTERPWIVHIGAVDANLLGIEVQAGRVTEMKQIPYEPRPGDATDVWMDETSGEPQSVTLIRDGERIGVLAGRERKILALREELVGEPLDEAAADCAESYQISSGDDPAYAGGRAPMRVCRKTKVNNWTQPRHEPAKRHWIYLELPSALRTDCRYVIDVSKLGLDEPEVAYTHDPLRLRSEAIHASHIGFRPADPGKCAFLSLWLGNGGVHSYPRGLPFSIVDDATDELVYEGTIGGVWPADKPERLKRNANYNLTDVLRMDFGDLTRPGRYRVCVKGIGCSYPFTIAKDVWAGPFRTSMRGCFVHRNGIELGPPHTEYRRPRCFHPDDGVKVYHSECPLMYSGNGLNALGTDTSNFGNLVAGRTAEIVPNAWGSYMDAGDWDRRIQHLDASRLQLELVDLFPSHFLDVCLNIPESGNDLPDVVNEALFNIDGYRRMQAPEGGIRGGIESAQHPVGGECSWQESHTVMAYKPGLWSSHVYAGVAARAAWVLRRFDTKLAAVYEESARRAMEWAETEYAGWPNRPEYPQVREGAKKSIADDRCLAAVEMYRLTGDAHWHRVYTETTALGKEQPDFADRQRDAAFVYARLRDEAADAALRETAVEFCIADADRGVEFQEGNAWLIATPYYDRMPQMGFYSQPGSTAIIRAHALTGREDYLRAIVQSAIFGAGGNPMNLCMTTGVGHDWPRNVLHVDSRRSEQPVPEGITIYGPADYPSGADRHYWRWPFKKGLDEDCTPPGSEWPPPEGYFDIYSWAPVCEYTVMQNLGPNSYCWGYLAARH